MFHFLQEFLHCGSIVALSQTRFLLGWGPKILASQPHPSCVSFYFPDFFLDNSEPWIFHPNTLEIELNDLENILNDESVSFQWIQSSEELFRKEFRRTLFLFQKTSLIKTVPYVFLESDFQKIPLESMLKSALNYVSNARAYVYGTWDHEEGILGATPELLFSKSKGNLLETMACAGTAKPGMGMLDDRKLMKEHQIVIEGISEQLRPLGQLSTGTTCVVSLPNLAHLVTPMTCSLKNPLSFEKIIESLHPTPALGAFPKELGREWLRDYARLVPRERYGAPAGYLLPNGECRVYVGIRNVQWKENRMHLGAGCGIIEESQEDTEWKEIERKQQSIRQLLGI